VRGQPCGRACQELQCRFRPGGVGLPIFRPGFLRMGWVWERDHQRRYDDRN
jgi:hypothetical protein